MACAVVLGTLLSGLLLRFGRYSLDSDSVAQQSLLLTWWRAGHETTFVPRDTWLLKLPVYALVELAPWSSPVRVLVESLVLNGIGYVLVAWSSWNRGSDRPGPSLDRRCAARDLGDHPVRRDRCHERTE